MGLVVMSNEELTRLRVIQDLNVRRTKPALCGLETLSCALEPSKNNMYVRNICSGT
jgi:hypothetical protein